MSQPPSVNDLIETLESIARQFRFTSLVLKPDLTNQEVRFHHLVTGKAVAIISLKGEPEAVHHINVDMIPQQHFLRLTLSQVLPGRVTFTEF